MVDTASPVAPSTAIAAATCQVTNCSQSSPSGSQTLAPDDRVAGPRIRNRQRYGKTDRESLVQAADGIFRSRQGIIETVHPALSAGLSTRSRDYRGTQQIVYREQLRQIKCKVLE